MSPAVRTLSLCQPQTGQHVKQFGMHSIHQATDTFPTISKNIQGLNRVPAAQRLHLNDSPWLVMREREKKGLNMQL